MSGALACLTAAPEVAASLSEIQRLQPVGGDQSYARSATRMVAEGAYLFVGAPALGQRGRTGLVYVYRRTQSGWILQYALRPPPGAAIRAFGRGVAADGDLLAVTGETSGFVGLAFVYRRSGNEYVHEATLESPDSSLGGLGAAVAIHDDLLAVSGPRLGVDPHNRGRRAVHLFAREQSVWRFLQQVTPPNRTAGFGASIGLVDGLMAVGAPGDYLDRRTNTGAVYLYRLNTSGRWKHLQKVRARDDNAFMDFGIDLDLQPRRLVVGAPGAGYPALTEGAVYVFEPDGEGVWVQTARLDTGRRGGPGLGLGRAVALEGAFVVAAFENASPDGVATVFKYVRGAWRRTGLLVPEEALPASPVIFAYSAAAEGREFFIGETLRGGSGDEEVRIFEYSRR